MHSIARNPEQYPEIVSLNVIRAETALSRYPVHRLAKQGTIDIEIREESETGDVLIRWEVDYGVNYGQPGPLAYKVDTLVVNRRIEEASRPIPRMIKLGSLKDLCRELGLRESGGNTNQLRKALHQNASAYITAKLRYKLTGGTSKELEAGFSRYSVVFTGEELPDGRRADAVYIVLNDVFMQVLNGAMTRPLDYDYLKGLSPASQRLYELLGFSMYAALKHGRPRAKLCYSEYCRHAPLTRHVDWERVRPQMAKIHGPHKKSGYITEIDFEQTTDKEGRPDWWMHYTPGPKAKAEYRAFTKRGGPQVLEIEQPSPAPPPPSGLTPLEEELINRGVTASTARKLVAEYPEERIRRQLEHADFLVETGAKEISNRGAYLAKAMREDFAPPPGFESQAVRAKRQEAEGAKRRREQQEARRRRAEQAREQAEQARILEYWNGLDPDEQRRLEAEALEQSEEPAASTYREMLGARNPLAPSALRCIREAHIRNLLATAPPTPAQ
ncbi:MAG: hypothetical protein ACM35G_15065 [Planctomycetaceae bacterium]